MLYVHACSSAWTIILTNSYYDYSNRDIKLGEARNHILLLNDDLPSSKGDRIGSYYHKVGRGDPNYNCYIDIVTDKDSTAYSFWVQDMYEMKIDDQNSINKKIELIESVALDAREYYKDSDNMVFNNQLNANTGNPVALKCVLFAQIFNSKTYEMFRGNMLNGGDPLWVVSTRWTMPEKKTTTDMPSRQRRQPSTASR